MRDLRRLQLLQITEFYPPDYGGGVAPYVQDICRFLAERGHDVTVFCIENNSGKEPYTLRVEQDDSIKVIRINLPYFVSQDPEGWQLGLKKWRKHQQRIATILDEITEAQKPDLIHCHYPGPLGEEFILDIEDKGTPMVWMLHDSSPSCLRRQFINSPTNEPCTGPSYLRCFQCIYSNFDGSQSKALIKLPWRILKLGLLPGYKIWQRTQTRKCGDGVIGYSQYIANANEPFMKGPVKYIPLGINLTGLPRIKPVRPRSPLRFGFVAGFQPHKGIWHVLDAAASLKRRGLKFELHIWGPYQEHKEVEVMSRDLADRVFLHGMYAIEDRWKVYTSIDVAIMATIWCEPFGRVIKEAGATGAPTIAPATGGITEQIRHGVDGLLYSFRDPLDLERQMARVLEEPSLYKTLSSGLLPVLDTRAAVADIENFYCDALASRLM